MLNTKYEWDGATLTVKPEGEMDSMTSPEFEKEFRHTVSGAGNIIVDFEKVNYISSAGMRVFLAMEQFLETQNTEMKLIHVNENIMEIFELVGFTEIIAIER